MLIIDIPSFGLGFVLGIVVGFGLLIYSLPRKPDEEVSNEEIEKELKNESNHP